MSMVGAFGEGKQVDADGQAVLDAVKGDVETSLGKTFATFEAVSMKTQVVAGTNFLFKVKADGDEYLSVKVFRPLPHTGQAPQMKEVKANLNADSEI